MNCLLKLARLLLCLGAVVLAACGQSSTTAMADWHSSGSEAKQIALQTHHPLFIAFMGSDWSEPCQAIRKDILDTQTFKDFADANLVLVMADFPRATPLLPEQARQNADMAKGAQLDRLPVFLMVDPRNGVAFGRIANFAGGADAFVAQLQTALDQYQQGLQNNAQPVDAASASAAAPLPSSVPSFSQSAPAPSTNAPGLPAFPGSLPSPEELMRRRQQSPPSPQ